MGAMIKKIRLKGHETFILREGWLTKGLAAAEKDGTVFSKNSGADALGVGTNMAKAIRYWMQSAGFIGKTENRATVKLESLGQLVFQKAPYFEDDFSDWLVHMNLVTNAEAVTSWYLFFNTLQAEEFTRTELEDYMLREYAVETGRTEIPRRSLADDCSAILRMYSRDHVEDYDPEDKSISPFANLGLLKLDGGKYRKSQPNLNRLSPFAVWYLIEKMWEENGNNSISIASLLEDEKGPGKVLQLKRAALNEYLDKLDNYGYIRLNRTAGLDMVYKNEEKDWGPYEVAELYYEK